MLARIWVWGRLGASIYISHYPARSFSEKMLARLCASIFAMVGIDG
jgi:hypothetical protein